MKNIQIYFDFLLKLDSFDSLDFALEEGDNITISVQFKITLLLCSGNRL